MSSKLRGLRIFAFLVVLLCLTTSLALAQTKSRLTGVVTDSSGAVVVGASVTVKNDGTAREVKTTTSDQGSFSVADLDVGSYTVTIAAPNFKQTIIKNVAVDAAQVASVTASLQPGDTKAEVIVTGGGEVLQTESTTVNSTIVGRQITELPFVSRDALDLVVNLPGSATPGRPRSTTVNGLPKGSLNITLDGVNVQDNTLRSNDGFFTYVRPRIDSIEEVSVSTATPGADSNGEGATQIRFITKGGTNRYSGGVYWYQKNRALNANTFFGNLNGQRRQAIILNEAGFKVGGPIWKDKVHFFTNYEEFHNPTSQPRTRQVFNNLTSVLGGNFTYKGTDNANHTVNVLDLVRNQVNGGVDDTTRKTTVDPIIKKMLTDIQGSLAGGTVSGTSNPLINNFDFINTGGDLRKFYTQRFDVQITSKLHIEDIYNYDKFGALGAGYDFLNSRDPAFPGLLAGTGGQNSGRFTNSFAVRYTVTNNIVNEFRYGLQGGTTRFAPEVNAAMYAQFGNARVTLGNGVTTPMLAPSNSKRNAPVDQFNDNLSWTRNAHAMTFGYSYSRYQLFTSAQNNVVPSYTLGVAANDLLIQSGTLFNAANLPTASAAQITSARNFYAMLVGSVSQVANTAYVNETTKGYSTTDPTINRAKMREFGFYGQDSWKVRSNLTLNYGLRYELQGPYFNTDAVFSRIKGGEAGLFGVSGLNNMFKPGTLTGSVPQFEAVTADTPSFNTDKNNFAPTFGLAYSPNFKFGDGGVGGVLRHIVGSEPGQFVVRGGYSISYVREGLNNYTSITGSNIGASFPLTVSQALGTLVTPRYLSDGLPTFTAPGPITFPFTANANTGVNEFDQNLKTGYVGSWTFGIQRELNRDTALEIRYVANHSTKLWRQVSLNEANVFENGFLTEFKAAQNNLALFRTANPLCGTTGNPACSFAFNAGLPGSVQLPIFQSAFTNAASNFTSTGNVTLLDQGQAGSFANNIATNATFINNLLNTNASVKSLSGVSVNVPNLFIVNPTVFSGGAFLFTNGGNSSYNSLQIELRRRFSKGLLIQGSYVASKAMSNAFASSSTSFSTFRTFRNPGLDRALSPFNLPQALKINYLYELPFGPGKRWSFGGGDLGSKILNKAIEGWQTDGVFRMQTGAPFLLTSGRGTFNTSDSGVVLHGITAKQLQDSVRYSVVPQAAGTTPSAKVFFLDPALAANSAAAFGAGGTFDPNKPYIGPPTTAGEFGQFVYLHAPRYTRTDMSLIKRTKITESVNMEVRLEFLNVFNANQFLVGSAANDLTSVGVNSSTFGQTTNYYQDFSTTNDVGSRMIRWVLRVNF